ncbi:hypothetical protein FJZ26_00195 [Candidatus Parvarchaeota archaeon]|nr:hypothetical protein [Candidatus Parvarchaeota archaeon]
MANAASFNPIDCLKRGTAKVSEGQKGGVRPVMLLACHEKNGCPSRISQGEKPSICKEAVKNPIQRKQLQDEGIEN